MCGGNGASCALRATGVFEFPIEQEPSVASMANRNMKDLLILLTAELLQDVGGIAVKANDVQVLRINALPDSAHLLQVKVYTQRHPEVLHCSGRMNGCLRSELTMKGTFAAVAAKAPLWPENSIWAAVLSSFGLQMELGAEDDMYLMGRQGSSPAPNASASETKLWNVSLAIMPQTRQEHGYRLTKDYFHKVGCCKCGSLQILWTGKSR